MLILNVRGMSLKDIVLLSIKKKKIYFIIKGKIGVGEENFGSKVYMTCP